MKFTASFGIGSEYKETAIFIEMAEVVILSQISNLLSSMPSDYLADFLPLPSPPEYLKNSIIRTIKDTILKDKSAATSMINNFENYWLPKNGSFTISHDAFNRPSQARLITLQNKYIRINITYQVTQNVYLSSVKHWLMHGAPFTEISDIAINPRYQADALKRLTEHQLRTVSFSYTTKTEIKKPKIFLFIIMLGIPPWSNIIKKFLSFLDYFVENLDYTSFGSVDLRSSETYERERLERQFILESMAELRNHLGRDEHPLHDDSKDYIM